MAIKLILHVISGILFFTTALYVVGDRNFEQQILDSTLMITIIVPELELLAIEGEALPIPRDEFRAIAKPDSYTAADGLATLLLNPDGEWIIITHDHWSVLDRDLGIVQIRNSHNQMVAEYQLWQFKSLVRYRNGGTMVLTAPDEITALLESEQHFSAGRSWRNHTITTENEVSLVYRKRDGRGGVAVIQAEVAGVEMKQGLPVLRLSNSAGLPVIGGDSGGGIWLDGKLVGNIWTKIMETDPETGELSLTHSSIAAVIDPAWME